MRVLTSSLHLILTSISAVFTLTTYENLNECPVLVPVSGCSQPAGCARNRILEVYDITIQNEPEDDESLLYGRVAFYQSIGCNGNRSLYVQLLPSLQNQSFPEDETTPLYLVISKKKHYNFTCKPVPLFYTLFGSLWELNEDATTGDQIVLEAAEGYGTTPYAAYAHIVELGHATSGKYSITQDDSGNSAAVDAEIISDILGSPCAISVVISSETESTTGGNMAVVATGSATGIAKEIATETVNGTVSTNVNIFYTFWTTDKQYSGVTTIDSLNLTGTSVATAMATATAVATASGTETMTNEETATAEATTSEHIVTDIFITLLPLTIVIDKTVITTTVFGVIVDSTSFSPSYVRVDTTIFATAKATATATVEVAATATISSDPVKSTLTGTFAPNGICTAIPSNKNSAIACIRRLLRKSAVSTIVPGKQISKMSFTAFLDEVRSFFRCGSRCCTSICDNTVFIEYASFVTSSLQLITASDSWGDTPVVFCGGSTGNTCGAVNQDICRCGRGVDAQVHALFEDICPSGNYNPVITSVNVLIPVETPV